jgi:hypothetical protein
MSPITGNAESAMRDISRIVRPSVSARRPCYQWATSSDGITAITRVLSRATETGWPPSMFATYGFGDHSVYRRLVHCEDHYCIDLTSYMQRYPIEQAAPEDRAREWVCAALKKPSREWAESLPATWPVISYGGGGRQTKGVRAESLKVPEPIVVAEYGKRWGVLAASYKKLHGAGWWRPRLVYAAMAGAVCYSDSREYAPLGETYQQPLDVIESMSAGGLHGLAHAQAEALRAAVWTGDRLQTEAQAMLKSVAGR